MLLQTYDTRGVLSEQRGYGTSFRGLFAVIMPRPVCVQDMWQDATDIDRRGNDARSSFRTTEDNTAESPTVKSTMVGLVFVDESW